MAWASPLAVLGKVTAPVVRSTTIASVQPYTPLELAGRAGRPGFDPDGHVWVQAPEHVIENTKALSRAGDDPKAIADAAAAEWDAITEKIGVDKQKAVYANWASKSGAYPKM